MIWNVGLMLRGLRTAPAGIFQARKCQQAKDELGGLEKFGMAGSRWAKMAT